MRTARVTKSCNDISGYTGCRDNESNQNILCLYSSLLLKNEVIVSSLLQMD